MNTKVWTSFIVLSIICHSCEALPGDVERNNIRLPVSKWLCCLFRKLREALIPLLFAQWISTYLMLLVFEFSLCLFCELPFHHRPSITWDFFFENNFVLILNTPKIIFQANQPMKNKVHYLDWNVIQCAPVSTNPASLVVGK